MTLAWHAWLVRDGTAITLPSVGSASISLVPDAADASWEAGKLGIIQSFEIDPGLGTPIEVMRGTPGFVTRVAVLEPTSNPVWTFEFKENDPLLKELAYQTLPLNSSSTQFNPGERSATVQGWIKAQGYSHDNVLREHWQVWGALRLKGSLKMELGQLVSYQIEFRPIMSTYNSGTL